MAERKIWLMNGKVVVEGGKVILCDTCPCRKGIYGFAGFENDEKHPIWYWFEYRACMDWDSCAETSDENRGYDTYTDKDGEEYRSAGIVDGLIEVRALEDGSTIETLRTLNKAKNHTGCCDGSVTRSRKLRDGGGCAGGGYSCMTVLSKMLFTKDQLTGWVQKYNKNGDVIMSWREAPDIEADEDFE